MGLRVMLEVCELERVPHEDWSRRVQQLGGNPLHLPQVYLADHAEKDLRLLAFREADVDVACGPAFSTASGRHLIGPKRTTLELPTPPAGGSRC